MNLLAERPGMIHISSENAQTGDTKICTFKWNILPLDLKLRVRRNEFGWPGAFRSVMGPWKNEVIISFFSGKTAPCAEVCPFISKKGNVKPQ